MGREIHRVPLDFDWEIDKTWKGYLPPKELEETVCPDCHGQGDTSARAWVQGIVYLLGMLARDLGDQKYGRRIHPYLSELPRSPDDGGELDHETRKWIRLPQIRRVSEDIVPLLAGLTGQPAEELTNRMMSDPSYPINDVLIKAAGLDPKTWGWCITCKAHGSLEKYEGQRAEAEAWERTDPPKGEGWQLWQTVSEGSPISPVFATAEELARWMTTPAYHWGASRGEEISYEGALAFVNVGWAPSGMVTREHGVETGEQFIGRTELEKGEDA
jgi:hypothetical protein